MRRALVAILLFAFFSVTGESRSAGVDLEVILAADVSRSIDDAEFDLQRKGYAAALTDPRVLAAIHEEDLKYVRASAPRAIRALSGLIENPKSRDHARGIAMVLDRVHPAETVHNVKVEHDATPAFKDTAQVLARIAELAAKFSVKLPPTIDVTPEKSGAAV